MRRGILLTLFFSITLALTGCATPSHDNDQSWYFSVVAPQHYKVWVEHLEFEKSGTRHWRMPMGNVECCWKGPNGPLGTGGRMSPFPNIIGIQWFSFAEQKFYQRLIELPENLPDLMSRKVEEKTSTGTSMGPRDQLVIGLAPGGEIVLWIMNQPGSEIEVARMQANPIKGDASWYKTRTQSYLKENDDYLKQHGIPTTGW
ncbi:DUF2931 family protein [Marinobacter sp. R17]|uniref:DUF2931 family protein n=1 Tax=Marinobacter sp. R17 TaxID=2484250 RepID=UPI000F4C7AD8|nr:DUF2931 family protein [Marinobacter sp. R17]ROT93640.1 DUF2931 family protein [Marinobacter sp. R17]